jgi:hypothetical protein
MKTTLRSFFLFFSMSLIIAACNSNQSSNSNTGDAGDSASIGQGTDTTGTLVDTGSAVTDTSKKQ